MANTVKTETQKVHEHFSFSMIVSVALVALSFLAIYSIGKLAIYNPIYDQGFEAGRLSAVRDCTGKGHINQCIEPRR